MPKCSAKRPPLTQNTPTDRPPSKERNDRYRSVPSASLLPLCKTLRRSSTVERGSHKPVAVGSNPAVATISTKGEKNS